VPQARKGTPFSDQGFRMKKIFLVEDDPTVAQLLHDFLSGHGHNMIFCERSVEASLETAKEGFDRRWHRRDKR
jgi:CheY-like chemotaxis protein